MRRIFVDTETTGLNPARDRIVEIGAVAYQDRSAVDGGDADWHSLIDPQCPVPEEAVRIHGLTADKLKGKPLFASVAREFVEFISGHEVVMHNAEFDVGFLNAELARCDMQPLAGHVAKVTDSLQLARRLYPHGSNSLDALARRFELDLEKLRPTHGALIDARLLAQVYLHMTSGQIALSLHTDTSTGVAGAAAAASFEVQLLPKDAAAHERHAQYLRKMHEDSGVKPLLADEYSKA